MMSLFPSDQLPEHSVGNKVVFATLLGRKPGRNIRAVKMGYRGDTPAHNQSHGAD